MAKTHQPTLAVRESFGQAQQQAAAMADPPPAWNAAAPSARRVRPRWLAVAAASVTAGGVVGWLVTDRASGPAPTPAASTARADDLTAPPPRAEPATATLASVATAPAPSTSLAVTRQAGVIRIASTNASLADAVRELARVTHTNVRGGEALASIKAPVTLNWRGSDTAAAWDALLGRHASIAVSCGGAACELWIVGIAASRAAGDAPVANEPAIAAPRPAVQAAPPPADENAETN